MGQVTVQVRIAHQFGPEKIATPDLNSNASGMWLAVLSSRQSYRWMAEIHLPK